MSRLRAARSLPPRVVDILLVVVMLAIEWGFELFMVCYQRHTGYDLLVFAPQERAVESLMILSVLLRRRYPVAVFSAVLLASALTGITDNFLTLVVLGTVAERSLGRALGAAAAYLTLRSWTFWQGAPLAGGPVYYLRLSEWAVLTAAAVLLGRLIHTRRVLARSMAELRETQEHERELHAQSVLARERAQLAREMHDVVSHQVSLIAVGAGALQIGADSSETREAARTIRKLSVTTLEELRHMVTLLRAVGSTDSGITPQPTRERLTALVTGSGLDARLIGEVPEGAGATVQRAVYRIVQEALTNVRKHAPGATATVEIRHHGQVLEVTVTNTAPTRAALQLPGSGLGLVGLRERAENLHGTLACGTTPDGGYRIHATLPGIGH
ncbi:sensor histidine kinase [Kitasatospora sp. NPDC059827]|uniref:sensor histidine kinase n=1 Tax=Kitasatospora sp. NPDC059827 TaxID=3346964 RepID=UPI00365E6FAE